MGTHSSYELGYYFLQLHQVNSVRFNVHIQSKLSRAHTPVMNWVVYLGQKVSSNNVRG